MSRPYCELHLHVEGTLEPSTIFDLARRQAITLPYGDQSELEARYRFEDLQSFLNLYYENMSVLRDQDAFTAMAWAYLLRAHRAGIAHVELFVDPQAHSVRGISEKTVLLGIQRALDRGLVELGISSGMIVCVLRDQPVASAHAMLDAVLATEVPVLGLGMDSAEVGYPPSLFTGVFEDARSAGWHVVAHAGEEGPPAYVWEALDVLGAERIDHGVRALEDDALVVRLARDRIPLTVCPLSNVALKVSPDVSAVPIRRMLDAGLRVTVNSDDPAYFGGYLDDNLSAIESAHALTPSELDLLCRNSIEASFITAQERTALLARLDA